MAVLKDEEAFIEINFKCQKQDTDKLVKFILQFANLNLNELAEIIEEERQHLDKVLNGHASLTAKARINVMQLFYMFAESCEFEL